jgi:predicted lipoprotein with Yx(FWY)xxD motif
MRLMRGFIILVVASALTGTAVAGSTSQALVKARTTSLGKILVAGNGKALYMFARDKSTKSMCTGQCATFWPPLLTTGAPKAGPGVKATLLGTSHRANGTVQVTYHGHPLYSFKQDTTDGQATGEATTAFGASWYALSPAGVKVMPAGGGGGGGGYP